MIGQWIGRALAGLVKGLLLLVVNLVIGLLKGLAMPFQMAVATTRRRFRRKRDVSALKHDWKVIRKGKAGKGKFAKRTRRRLQKRLSKLR